MLADGRSIALLEGLGQGSVGAVYRGLLESSYGVRRPVAVKLLAVDGDPDDAMRHLGKMARRSACIRHHNVIQILEIDRADNHHSADSAMPFIVMELVEGESLASVLAGWREDNLRVPVDFATVVALRTAEALGAALFADNVEGGLTHLVHGDLSPRQILISNQGEVKLGDFGLGGFIDISSRVRSRSRIAYTAPEIAAGGPPTARADVFSLGVILHEMLIGPRFAQGTSHHEALKMVNGGHIHQSLMEPNLPRSLRAVLEKATQRNPADRYQHARAMAFDLRREMLRLNLTDAQTCIRHAVVGWCEVRSETRESIPLIDLHEVYGMVLAPRKSDVVPSGRPVSGYDFGTPEDTNPEIPIALRRAPRF